MTNGAGGGRRLRQLLDKENDDVLRSHTLMTVKLAETGRSPPAAERVVRGANTKNSTVPCANPVVLAPC